MRKRFLSILMAAIMTLSLLPATAFADKAAEPTETWADAVKELEAAPEGYSQTGTTISISSALGLAWFAYQINSWESQAEGEKVNFENYTINITEDIDLSGRLWTPIDTATVITNVSDSDYKDDRAGTYNNKLLDGATINGNKHTIKGMTVHNTVRGPVPGAVTSGGQSCFYYAGFIGRNSGALTITDLSFSNAVVDGANEESIGKNGGSSFAVVAGHNSGTLTLENVTVSDSTVSGYTKIAGLVGQQAGRLTVKNSAVTGCTFNILPCNDDPEGGMASPIMGITTTSTVTLYGITVRGNTYHDQSTWSGGKTTLEDGRIVGISGGYQYVIWAPFSMSGSSSYIAPAASIDGAMYTSLADAISAAQDGEKVSLIGDVEFSDTISIDADKAITLDLNGHNAEYTGTGTFAVRLSGGIDLTITGQGTLSGIKRVIQVGDSDYFGTGTGDPASLTLEGGSRISTSYVEEDGDEWYHCAIGINANNTVNHGEDEAIPCVVTIKDATVNGGVYLFGQGAELNVNKGAVLTSEGSYTIGGNGGVSTGYNRGDTVVNITGGTLSQTVKNGTVLYQPQSGTVNISGDPTLTGYTGIQLCSGEGTVANITGGTVTATGADARDGKTGDGYIPDGAAISVVNRSYPGGTPKMNISGGKFVSKQSSAVLAYTWDSGKTGTDKYPVWEDADEYLSISGGTYTSASDTNCVELYLATGYEATNPSRNTWTVVPKEGGELVVEVETTQDGTVSSTLAGIYAGAETAVEVPSDGAGSETEEMAGLDVAVNLTTEDGSTDGTAQLTVNADTAQSLVTANAQSLAVVSNVGTVTLDREALSQLEDVTDEVVISLTKTAGTNKWEVTVTVGGQEIFDDAPGGEITISVTAPSGVTDNDNFKVYCVDNGMEDMKADYAPGEGEGASGTWTWTTTHLSTFMGIEVDDDDQAVWVIGSGDSAATGHGTFAEAITALSSANDPVTITLVDNVTIEGDSNTSLISIPANKSVTIQNAEGYDYSITANFKYVNNDASSPNTGKNTGVVYLGDDSSLTISGVTLNLNGNDNSQQGDATGIHMGTGFVLRPDSTLTLNNGTVAKLDILSRGFIHYGSGDALTNVIIDGATLNVTNVSGNGSNGGAWTIRNDSNVTFENIVNHGLSVESLTVDDSNVTVNNAGYVGIYADEITLQNQANVEVTNCGNNEDVTTASSGIYKDKGAVQLKNDTSSLIVTGSTLTLSGNGNNAKEDEQTIYVGKGTVTTDNADITGTVTVASGAGCVVSYVVDGTQVEVQIVSSGSNITHPADPEKAGYTFLGWYDESGNEITDGATVTSDMTLTAHWSSTGGGGGGGTTRYTVTVEDSANGEVKSSHSRASRGTRVTLTVEPDEGYILDELVVTDANGDELNLTRKSSSQYTFTMPRSRVTVEASFVEGEEPDHDCPSEDYDDLSTSTWYHNAVDYVLSEGMMSGVSRYEFAPDDTLTRAMVVQILWAMEGKPQVDYLMRYDDVASGAWYAEAIRWGVSEGIVSGYSESTFGPEDPVTREQLMTILYAYAQQKDLGFTGNWMFQLDYADADAVSIWAYEAACWCTMENVVSGKSGNQLDPAGTATRAEAAQMLMNFSLVLDEA